MFHRKYLSYCYGVRSRTSLHSVYLIEQWFFNYVCFRQYHEVVFKCSVLLVVNYVQTHLYSSLVSVLPNKPYIIPRTNVKTIYNTTHYNSVLFICRALSIISIWRFYQLRSPLFKATFYVWENRFYLKETIFLILSELTILEWCGNSSELTRSFGSSDSGLHVDSSWSSGFNGGCIESSKQLGVEKALWTLRRII